MNRVAAGGIFDGRGIAAALMLGAVGVNLGS
jgi:NAD(P)H-dependent flavin oxidoreductase YrpB (nitropropane dioxygenase family)